MSDQIPEGYCQCGCGRKTTIAPQTCTRNSYIKGKPVRFIKGHATRLRYADFPSQDPNPSGLCQCSCGQKTHVPTFTDRHANYFKGKPMRYIQGHSNKPQKPQYIIDPKTGCWNWNWYRSAKGYGQLSSDAQIRPAHIVFYERKFGPISDGLQLHHTCENPPCVNPDHLVPVTPTEHLRVDSRTKLTVDQVQEIRRLHAKDNITQVELARQFNVHPSTISAIINRRNWKDV